MNILILSNKLPYPPKDGGSIATLNLARGLSKLNNKIFILALNTSKHYYNINNIPSELKKELTFKDVKINTRINLIKLILNLLFSVKPYIASRFYSKKFKIALKQILINNKYDIVQIEGLYMCRYIAIIRKNSTAKISYRAHNLEDKIWEGIAKNTTSYIKNLYINNLVKRIRRFDKFYINKYDFLIPITQNDANTYVYYGTKCPIHVCPAGFDFEKTNKYKSNNQDNSIFFIGALDWLPNQEGLMWFLDKVWSKISNSDDIKFYIAGRNATNKFIKSIQKYKVYFLGEVDDAYEFMSSKTIMIVPLFSGSGMRVKIIEGMAMGKVIISTSLGAEGINYTNKKNIYVTDSANEFIEIIKLLAGNSKLVQKISKNSHEYVRNNFNNEMLAHTLNNFYISQIEKNKKY